MKRLKDSSALILLAILLFTITMSASPATPEKPYPALADGDRLQAAWLMGMFNVLYDWAQTTNNDYGLHVLATAAHGAAGSIVGTTNTQSLTNKTLDSTNSVAGEAIKSGTVADARIASTIARDSEVSASVSAHSGLSAAHGATGSIVGTTNTQSLANKTLDSTNSVAGEAIKSGTVADARIASTIARDTEVAAHAALTITHGATGAVVGTTNTQTITNKTMGTGCTWGGTAVPVANGGTGATTAATALTNLGLTSTAAEINLLDGVTATTAEINYVDGVTSAIQTQINAKSATTHTHNYAGSASAGGAANSVANTLTRGTGLTGSNFNGSAATTWAVSYGTAAGTACQGNDARLSDARTPTTHTHNYAGSASAGGAATSALTATTATTASTANAIRTSAPASPANGDIWTE